VCIILKCVRNADVAAAACHYNPQYWLPGPYLGTLRPWAQEIFAPPPPHLFVFSYVQLSFQVQLISSTIPAITLGK